MPSGQQIQIEGSFIWIRIPDFNFVAVTRSGPVADCQNDSGRMSRTRKLAHAIAYYSCLVAKATFQAESRSCGD
jgi:hypothetical protein